MSFATFLLRLANMDLFGREVTTINFRGRKKLYSALGLFFTLAAIGFVMTMTVTLVLQLFARKKPNFVQYTRQGGAQGEIFHFSEDDFFLMMGVTDGNQVDYVDFSIYEVTAYLINYEIGERRDFEIKRCSQSPDHKHYNRFCFGIGEGIYGDDEVFVNDQFGFVLQVEIAACSNSTKPDNSCAPPEVINQTMKGNYFFIEFPSWAVDPTDYADPFKYYLKRHSTSLLLEQAKWYDVPLEVIEITTDDGLLFESTFVQRRVHITPPEVEIEEKVSNLLLTFETFLNGNKIVNHRQYSRISDVVAQVSGLASLALVIGGLLVYPYTDMKIAEKLVNYQYDIRIDGDQKRKPENKKNKNKKSKKSENISRTDTYTVKDKIPPDFEFSQETQHFRHMSIQSPKSPMSPMSSLSSPAKKNASPIDIQFMGEPIKFNNGTPTLENLDYQNNLFGPKKQRLQTHTTGYPFNPVNPKSGQLTTEGHFAMTIPNQDDRDAIYGKNTLTVPEFCFEPEMRVTSEPQLDIFNAENDNPRPLDISYCEWLLSFIKRSPQMATLKRVEQTVIGKIEVFDLMKKVAEIDKLKACLMSPDQRILFDNLPKPFITYDNVTNKVKVEDWTKSNEGKEAKVKEAYWNIKTSNNKSEFDFRMLGLFEDKRYR